MTRNETLLALADDIRTLNAIEDRCTALGECAYSDAKNAVDSVADARCAVSGLLAQVAMFAEATIIGSEGKPLPGHEGGASSPGLSSRDLRIGMRVSGVGDNCDNVRIVEIAENGVFIEIDGGRNHGCVEGVAYDEGFSVDIDDGQDEKIDGIDKAFVRVGQRIADYSSKGGSESVVVSVNDAGVMARHSSDGEDAEPHFVEWGELAVFIDGVPFGNQGRKAVKA